MYAIAGRLAPINNTDTQIQKNALRVLCTRWTFIRSFTAYLSDSPAHVIIDKNKPKPNRNEAEQGEWAKQRGRERVELNGLI